MDPMLERLERAAQGVRPRPPQIPLVSNVTGKLLDTAPDGAYWRAHARQSVRFADGLQTLRGLGAGVFMEMGPGAALAALGRHALDDAGAATWLTTLPRRGAELDATTEALASLYLEGATIDWREVHRGTSARRISMPTYPFQRKRYWLDPVAPSGAAPPAAPPPAETHPLLGRAAVLDGHPGFETAWSVARLPYLGDHRIGGALILPTAVAVEAGLAAARAHFGARALGIEDLVYHKVLRFQDGDERRVRVTLVPVGADRADFSLASLDGAGDWRVHVTGVVTVLNGDDGAGAAPVDTRRGRVIVPDRFYAGLRAIGLDYGASFRGLSELRRGRAAAVGRVRLPAVVAPDGYGIHPAFLDACLHVFPAVLGPNGRRRGRSDTTYLPVGIERVRVYRDRVIEGRVSATLRPETGRQRGPVVDIRVVDEAGRPIATIEGLSLRALRTDRLGEDDPADAPTLYHVGWEARARVTAAERVPRGPGAWLVFAGADGLGGRCAAELDRRGAHCHVVSPGHAFARKGARTWTLDPRRPEHFRRLLGEVARCEPLPLQGTLFLWAIDAAASRTLTLAELERAEAQGVGAALFLVQALIDARSADREAGKVWFVTRAAQLPERVAGPVSLPQSSLWGLGRTVALEAPAIWGGLVDVSANEATALVDEIAEPDGESQIVLRDDSRYVARLRRLAADSAPVRRAPARFRRDATYLVTGGLGMLGLRTARHLVESHGVRSLVLVGRRRPTRRAQAAALAPLRARGARVRVVAADVAREADVRRLLRSLRGLPPLRGVFHGAGVLEDAILARMTWAQFTRVTAAKVRGSWLLHQHTRGMPLDHFVLHSSLLSLTGSAGQANYTAANAFLDALVDHRRALGLPATAFNWGPWAEAGMARSTGARGEAMWKARGVRYLAPERAMQALDLALRRGLAHVAVAGIDWPAFVAALPAAGASFYEGVRVATAMPTAGRARGTDAVADRLRRAAPGDRRGIVLEVVRRHVMSELGFEELIDTRQPLSELGLDSLMSVNVANRLEAALGMPVPVVKLIRGPSIERLVDGLMAGLDGAMPSGGPGARAVSAEPTGSSPGAALPGDGWLVVPRRRPEAAVRLICFPFAGAGAAPFRPWADALHPSIELVAVEPPGRASRIQEPPERDLEQFFERLTSALAPVLDRPAAFFGHCLGGLIGWETARRLRQRGLVDLRAFFVAGVRPPHRLTREGHFEHTLLERMLRHETFDPLRPAHEQPDEVFAEITRHFNIDATEEFLAQPELRRLLLPTVRADFALTAAYRYQPEPPWDVPVTCFAGLDDPYVSREDAGAWSEYTRRAFRLHWRPGAHFLVVDDRSFIIETLNRELTA
jgi:surfactin synthase thioesterase subunit/acyl transferase domain-containing protein